MMSIEMLGGIVKILSMVTSTPCFDEKIRILEGKYEYLRAMTEDLETGKNQETDDAVFLWLSDARHLLLELECLLNEAGQQTGLLMRANIMNLLDRFIDELTGRESEGHPSFLQDSSTDQQGLTRINYIPVKELIGKGPAEALENLEALLRDFLVGRIVIYGVEGIGKTTLMKHLYNCVSNWVDSKFEHIFWVTSPDEFSIKHLQDAVAAAVKCVLPCCDDLIVRAEIISEKLSALGSCVFFLDDVPEPDFCVEKVGVPVDSDEGNGCKVVLNTSATLDSKFLESCVSVELDRLAEDEAYQLFLCESGIDTALSSSLSDIPKLLVEMCHGIPLLIEIVATRMRGITDPHEWRNALLESSSLGQR